MNDSGMAADGRSRDGLLDGWYVRPVRETIDKGEARVEFVFAAVDDGWTTSGVGNALSRVAAGRL